MGILPMKILACITARKAVRSHRASLPAAFMKTVDHHVAQVLGVAVGGNSAGDLGHLLDEVHQAKIEIILDEGEAGEMDALCGAAFGFGESDPRGSLGGWVDEVQIAGLDVRGWLAVGDRDDLLVLSRLLFENPPGKLQARVDIREVLRDETWR